MGWVRDWLITVIAAVAAIAAGYMVASGADKAMLLATAGVGGLSLLVLALAARRWPVVVLGPLAVVIVLTPKTGHEPLTSVAGVSILPSDTVLAVASIAALLGAGRVGRRLHGRRLAAGVLAVLVVVQTLLGFMLFGTAAVLDARTYLLLLAPAAYLLSLDELPRVAVRRWLYITCSALVVMAIFRGLTQGWGHADVLVVTDEGGLVTTRVLLASQAVLVGAGVVTAWYDWAAGRSVQYAALGLAFLTTVTLAQHRSVWIATAAGLLVVTLRIPLRPLLKHVAVAVWVLMLASPLIVYSPAASALGELVAASSKSASLTSGTGGDRTESARHLIYEGSHSGPARLLLGEPFGGGYERVVMGRLEEYQPHNAYVQTFIRTGLVGITAVASLLLTVAWSAMRRRTATPTSVGWIALMAVFSLAYAFPFELAPLLALALVRQDAPSSATGLGTRGRPLHAQAKLPA